jgi:ABC-type transporter Mla MlaB component
MAWPIACTLCCALSKEEREAGVQQRKFVLRITISDSPTEQKWSLQGRLAGQWVAALRSAWDSAREKIGSRRCVVDLNQVTSIDRTGEVALTEMMNQGAEFTADGVYTKELLRNLRCAR